MLPDSEVIWMYSNFFGEMVQMAERLHSENEGYAAILVLFNLIEAVCKSLRQNSNNGVASDIQWLFENEYITEDDYVFLNGENGVRKIRNLIVHKDIYEYCFEDIQNNIAYPFADMETWNMIYRSYSPRIIRILSVAIQKHC